ncbi:MAG: glycosyltransferase family 2 protein [Acidobacteria bacterium]|nr:glycosyltransferase family 2 protein [Acidobacteriota bacterium]
MSTPGVHFVIVSYNTRALLGDLLDYFDRASLPFPFTVTVVDNASADGSPDVVRDHPRATLVANDRNTGYGAAVNAGFRQSDAAYVCVLNTDVVLTDGALAACHAFLEGRPDASGVSPVVRWPDGRLQTFWIGFGFGILGLDLLRKLSNMRMRRRLRRSRKPVRTDGVKGAFLFLRSAPFRTSKAIFDEDYFFYFEDTDLALRMRRAGLKTYILTRIDIVHLGGQSPSSLKTELFLRNRHRFFHKNLKGWNRWLALAWERYRVYRKILYYGTAALFTKSDRIAMKLGTYRTELRIARECRDLYRGHPIPSGFAAESTKEGHDG